MRTTINLDDNLIKELMRVSRIKQKRGIIHLAISEFLRRKKVGGLFALESKVHPKLGWRELEDEELKAQQVAEPIW